MPRSKKSHTVRNLDDDLMGVAPPKETSAARCVPLATGAMAMSVCNGEQHKAEGYEYRLGEEDAPESGAQEDPEGTKRERKEGEETSGDE